MAVARILVTDDEKEILVSCRKILERAGHEVATAADGGEALELLKAGHYDLFLVDLKMPGRSGMEILSLARALDPALMAIMFTAYATLETAVEAVKRGAFDYLAKPFTADQLRLAAERALRHKNLLQENLNLREQLTANFGFDKILGASEAMSKVFGTLQKVMRSDANILIQGESGTGKELVARTIHAHSLRRDNPFVAVDCAALPESLLESELFGHEKGSFTGADRASRGLLELAHTGTLFLDEIGELYPALQAKLLRTLQERELRRLGSEKTIPVDLRVIAATNRNLRAEIANKNFREDLYYRLNVVHVLLPPLRERKGDIPLLANHFLQHFSQQYHRATRTLLPEVMKLFLSYTWPGNVRELQNVLQHAVLLAETDSVRAGDLPENLQTEFPQELSFQRLREQQAKAVEKTFLVELLRKHKGNISEASAEAHMTRKMIYRLAKKFDLDLESFRHA
ncbi:MAG: sigma-54-dependent Fis family transcriptional regulator [Acidobacteria bacterium]|nr:sigma-54-dependent Fis family transcriptional regulator [Acidobacteriota bacterium]